MNDILFNCDLVSSRIEAPHPLYFPSPRDPLMLRSASLIALSVTLLAAPALAEGVTDNAPTAETTVENANAAADAPHHDEESADIVVTGVRKKEGDVLGGLSVLDAED